MQFVDKCGDKPLAPNDFVLFFAMLQTIVTQNTLSVVFLPNFDTV